MIRVTLKNFGFQPYQYPLVTKFYDLMIKYYWMLSFNAVAIDTAPAPVSGRDSRTMIGRTRHVTSPIWSRIDWLAGPKIRIVGLRFVELKMDKTVHFKTLLPFVWEE